VGIAPEFRGTNDITVGIQRHEAVLLARHANAAHAGAINFFRQLSDDVVQRLGPFLRTLLHVTGRKTGDQRVRSAGLRNDAAGLKVEGDGFGALGA